RVIFHARRAAANNARITANNVRNARTAANNARTAANNARTAANNARTTFYARCTTANNARTTANTAHTTAQGALNAAKLAFEQHTVRSALDGLDTTLSRGALRKAGLRLRHGELILNPARTGGGLINEAKRAVRQMKNAVGESADQQTKAAKDLEKGMI